MRWPRMKREAGGGLNPVDDSRLRKPHDSSAPEEVDRHRFVGVNVEPIGRRRGHLVEVSGPHNTDCRAGRGHLQLALVHLPPRPQQLHDTDLVLGRVTSPLVCLLLKEKADS